ncbi:hypothetical protein GWC95_08425 [Sediminibacterium roseum]|uniref:Uncharacterized protein n=1 Tax=Sediminibacterium roseum TaxID=1978412 RepID=A0ABW9ZSK4_9BACT|nr:hypothetical protein [Sediminibacterium roseum]NCI49944.1 hypothetical protein [Sediminibacterium roseum]
MQKRIFISGFLFVFLAMSAGAQRKLEPGGMTYLVAAKPNVIIYHDSVFNGVKEFRSLFYRHRDVELITYLERHQSNKITGQVLGFIGTLSTIIGVGTLSNNKTAGWIMIGGGFASTITSGYLLMMGQRNLATAVTLFNRRYRTASLGIGVGGNTAGLVYKF